MDWTKIIITLLAGTNLSTIIYFFATLKAKKKKENAEADIILSNAKIKELDFTEKIISIYNTLSADQRNFFEVKIRDLNQKIGDLETKVTELQTERCVNHSCVNRIK